MVSSLTLKTALRENAYFSDTDDMISSLEKKTREIKSLIKEKNKILEKIQTAMDLMAYTKTPLSEIQMDCFSEFTKGFELQRRVVADALVAIDGRKDLSQVKRELLHNDTDFALVIYELNHIFTYQNDAINSLKKIIEYAERMLKALQN